MTAEQESALLQEVADLRRRVERFERPEDANAIKFIVRGNRIISGSYEQFNGYRTEIEEQDLGRGAFFLNTGQGQVVIVGTSPADVRAFLDDNYPMP
jgi:hypothetical protein